MSIPANANCVTAVNLNEFHFRINITIITDVLELNVSNHEIYSCIVSGLLILNTDAYCLKVDRK
jgi:hypothetical protein